MACLQRETGRWGAFMRLAKNILDMTLTDNSRQAFFSPEARVSRSRFYLIFLVSFLTRFSAVYENEFKIYLSSLKL